MKNLISAILFIFIVFFTGCGGGGEGGSSSNSTNSSNTNSNTEDTTNKTVMVIGTEYTIASGDTIEETQSDTNVTVKAKLDTNSTISVLISGGANILHQ